MNFVLYGPLNTMREEMSRRAHFRSCLLKLGALSNAALRALAWAAREDHGPFRNGLGFTRSSLESLERQGLVTRKDPEALRLMALHRGGPDALKYSHDYDWFPVRITDRGRSMLKQS